MTRRVDGRAVAMLEGHRREGGGRKSTVACHGSKMLLRARRRGCVRSVSELHRTVHERPAAPESQGRAGSKQKLRLWLRLLRASRAIEAELRERLRVEFGTTLPKFDVMAALARKGAGMTMTELSRFLMVSNGNVTGIIDRLVAEGMVVRLAHAGDRRATFVRLTPKGAQQFQAMAKAHEAWIGELLAGVGREDTDTLVGLLGTLGAPARGGEQIAMTWLEPITLSSSRVRLELLDHRHESDLIEAVKDGELWRLWYTSVPAPEKMGAEIDRRLGLHAAGTMLPFAVIDVATARPSA